MIVHPLVAQGGANDPTVSGELTARLQNIELDRLDVAVAYATLSGLTVLHDAVGDWPPVTRWVVGLDDAITQPAAIDALLALDGAEVRLARLGPQRRFHPKLYCLWSSQNAAECIVVIGSGNMTHHGLSRNGEAAVLLQAESEAEANEIRAAWSTLSALGLPAADVDLDAYRALYAKARKARRRMTKEGVVPLQPEAEEDAQLASQVTEGAATFWLEIGSAIGGRELELPRAVLPFFDIPDGAVETFRSFILPNHQEVTLRLIDRAANDMWRLEFTADSIRAMATRPTFRRLDGTRRSDLALHLSREGALFRARTVLIDSDDYQALSAASAAGVIGNTGGANGRAYGFY
jgi:HKD family nuclease